MAIPESQLEAWSRQGPVMQSSGTYMAVRTALMSSRADYAAQSFDVFLQGSYANDTNIHGETDVDTVIRLNTIFWL
jgi:tRNA nucleotidyltransferase (CCA-adding enzyme)